MGKRNKTFKRHCQIMRASRSNKDWTTPRGQGKGQSSFLHRLEKGFLGPILGQALFTVICLISPFRPHSSPQWVSLSRLPVRNLRALSSVDWRREERALGVGVGGTEGGRLIKNNFWYHTGNQLTIYELNQIAGQVQKTKPTYLCRLERDTGEWGSPAPFPLCNYPTTPQSTACGNARLEQFWKYLTFHLIKGAQGN